MNSHSDVAVTGFTESRVVTLNPEGTDLVVGPITATLDLRLTNSDGQALDIQVDVAPGVLDFYFGR